MIFSNLFDYVIVRPPVFGRRYQKLGYEELIKKLILLNKDDIFFEGIDEESIEFGVDFYMKGTMSLPKVYF